MLLISMLWMILIKESKTNSRIFILTLLWSILLELNNLFSFTTLVSCSSTTLLNNLYLWSDNTARISIFCYFIFILLDLLDTGKTTKEKNQNIKGLALIGIILLLNVNDYISFYITLECQSLILYILASRDGISSGLKYFVIGSLSSAIILLGISWIYTETSITEILLPAQISTIETNSSSYFPINSGEKMGIRMIILGLLIKLGVPPFHQWNIEILSNTKSDLTIYFSTLSKISLIYILLYISNTDTYNDIENNIMKNIISIFTIGCLVYGTFQALLQQKVKRLLAYSGIVHLGFILLSYSDNNSIEIIYNLPPLILYIYQYFISLMIILIISEQINAYYLHEYHLNNFLMIILLIHLLSLSGFPPLIGFVAKWVILKIAIGQYFMICLIAMLASVFSFFIYFNWFIKVIAGKSFISSTFYAWFISWFTWSSFAMLFNHWTFFECFY